MNHADAHRFNLYFVLLVVGQFMNKLYKRWGKAFITAMKEARRSYRTRQALAQKMSAAAAATTSHSNFPAAAWDQAFSFSDDGAISAVVPNPFKFDAANPPAFAPPGATPAVEPYPSLGSENAAQQASTSFFARSPVRRKSGSGGGGGSGNSSSTAVSARDGGGGGGSGSGGGGGGGSGLLTPREQRGTSPFPRATPLASPTRSRSLKSGGTAAGGVSGVGAAASEASRSVRGGGGVSRRWSVPWGKKVRISVGGGGGGGGGVGARGGNSPGDGMTLYEERNATGGEQGGDDGLASPVPPPRLRPRGDKRATRRRVRWARVFGAFVGLIGALTMLMAAVSAYLFPRNGLESPFPLIPLPLWQGAAGIGLASLWQGEDEAMPATKMTTKCRSQLERFSFSFGESGGVDDGEGEDEAIGKGEGAEPLLQ